MNSSSLLFDDLDDSDDDNDDDNERVGRGRI